MSEKPKKKGTPVIKPGQTPDGDQKRDVAKPKGRKKTPRPPGR